MKERPCAYYDSDGQIVAVADSIRQLSIKINKAPSTICMGLQRGSRHYGYIDIDDIDKIVQQAVSEKLSQIQIAIGERKRLLKGRDDYEKGKTQMADEITEVIDTMQREAEFEEEKKKEEIERHTDRQIYDGCINLLEKMVDYFQEYLEYLGYDLDKLDEDERFAVGMSNMEIVRQLFLYQTRNSGGCSTRDFCEKLGVDPYDSVKFEFEESEDE